MDTINKVDVLNALGRINSNSNNHNTSEIASVNKIFNNFIQNENRTRMYYREIKVNSYEKNLFEKVGILK